MLFPFRHNSFPVFPYTYLSFFRWLCTGTPITGASSFPPPAHAQNRLNYLRMFFRLGMQLQNYQTNDYELALLSALRTISSISDVFLGQQIHSRVLKSGLGFNTFITNSLISMYAKCGVIEDARSLFDSCASLDTVSCNIMISGYVKSGNLNNARQLFEIMPWKDCISYTTMIMGLARNECWTEAIEAFKDMKSAGILPSDLTMLNIISACSHIGGIWDCRILHALLIKLQLLRFDFVSTNLLNLYCACSSVGEARILFDEMPELDIVSWNAMLNGYTKAGLVDVAKQFFETIPTKDVVSWGTMIDGFVQLERLTEALTAFRAMLSTGLRANDVMVVDLVSACGRFTAFAEGLQFHAMIVKESFDCYDFIQATIINFYSACGRTILARLQFEIGIQDHLPSWSALIAGYIKNGMIDQARGLFDEMPEKDVFSWSAMISGYTQNEQPYEALELFHGMKASGIEANEITMVSVLSAIASLGTLREGRLAHEYIHSNSIPLNDILMTAIVDMYAKCGSINTAVEIFHQFCDKVSTISLWNAIICGLAIHGQAKLSLEIFSDLQGRHIELNSITFIGVLSACCHAGLVEVGQRHFKSMKNVYNIEPDIKHYGCMVDLLGRAGRLEEAEDLIKSMPMEADFVLWGTVLAACRTHGNIEIGERAAESVARLEPSHGASRVLLGNLYADAGRYEEAFSVRRSMLVLGMMKSPGCSGIV
ncbi:pentatricopeptide repeat-containing protein At5g19020, mitochondrial-like [Humulus lupulus]|uniref:pentatricopeptide repeat-containing protein At5g19020, mitochondrial-like n=1 Tax=Humulus lupulus TaxID=3486 RepID=UPI002B400EA4|nr:pentatricopeptide repeat-containing protein At5g19020, mitochondrial-like [Humulus lupulus]